jgi:copper(I)-binding protein
MKFSPFAILLFLVAAVAQAQNTAPVSVKDAWVRATVPAQKTTGAFMLLTAAAGSRLVEVRSPAAGIVEIHEMTMIDNVMKMRAVPGIDLPPGKTVELNSGGYHVMLMELKGPVREGGSVPLTLIFEGKDKKRQSVEVKAAVRPLNAPAKAEEQHKGH